MMNLEGSMALPVGLGGESTRPMRKRASGTPASPGDVERIMSFGRDPGDHGNGACSKRIRALTEGDLNLDPD
ncbi:MAG: hypothetical protein RL681_370 [Candidatus Parcubacteria bacterium]